MDSSSVRRAALATAGAFLLGVAPVLAAPPNPGAEIVLRKSFGSQVPGGAQAGSAEPGGAAAGGVPADPSPSPPGPAAPPAALAPAIGALGESLSPQGTLHLPDVGGREIVLDTGATPLLELASGRRLIVDTAGSISPGDAAAITRRWPSHGVLRVDADADARTLLGAILDASGYASVMRGAPITFGGEAAVRIVPDYLVLRTGDDLLAGEPRAISVVDRPADALPDELRDLAAAHRILVLELLAPGGGAAPGGGWREPRGRVTTVGTDGAALVILELADAIGASATPASPGSGALRVARGGSAATVLTRRAGVPGTPAPGTVDAADPRRLDAAVGELLAALGVPAVGPAVELSRPRADGGERRFTITVPGWLVEQGGRRLLVTGAALPPQLRLFLAREGIDILAYRVR